MKNVEYDPNKAEDTEFLQDMEDQMDLDLARKALKRNDTVAWNAWFHKSDTESTKE
jgi:hypothetical protein